MSDHDETDDGAEAAEHDGHDDHGHDSDEGRVTSPMQDFGTAEVTRGFAILVVGLVVVFGIPLLL